jgi:two-component system nitrogen regulation sensor histidine kinase GlnL
VSGAEGDIAAPSAAEQIEGLTFALLLLDKGSVIRQVNQAGEDLIGVGARRLVGQELCQVVSIGDQLIADRLAEPEAQLTARGVPVRFGERDSRANITVSSLASHPGWRVMTISDAGPSDRLGDENRASPLRGPAILAHEIKNPLSAIRGAAQLLARKAGEGEKPMTDLIASEVDRIAELIDRMQRLGREQPEPVAPLNLHQAIRRACETVFTPADNDIILREEFDPSLPPVLANEGALVQVLVNLIANARDASRESEAPQVTLRTRFVSGLVLNVMRLGRPVKLPIEIQVTDNGPGIDPSLDEHIFEPFVTTKPHGQGLGLALVSKLVRDMNGRISHERDEAAGLTHFRVHLPMARQEAVK